MFHSHRVQIYYEDTDFSGVVYHANYLKFFERAREHMLGVEHLVSLYEDHGVGFVVYKASMTFREGARFGDLLDIRSTVRAESAYRLIFQQDAWRAAGARALVEGEIHLACVDRKNKLTALPKAIIDALDTHTFFTD
ncbi:MAG: acyl-CoA thioester hydrolase [Myxococcota bacterium]|jgi:acyl-CoA thioester hydrolase